MEKREKDSGKDDLINKNKKKKNTKPYSWSLKKLSSNYIK